MARKGRPPGATNRAWPTVTHLPPGCPSCGGTERESLRIVVERHISGELPDGRAYDRVVWRNVRCRGCGQHYRVRSYEKDSGNPAIPAEDGAQVDQSSG